ncbi:rhomboid family intramembrane serine protease [Agaricicola taiwanensis]|uniref:Rhomboid family intramembrane serine protease n=1 Tax=Agaricicola taiwanensis TaxID=591372 RepID=A0A8J3DZ81_9RHOB|nr:rhomboid family intramembrane serine protease [Agaricicola taiwanensis]GGE50937.1 rhomboid family intramembrane serine protease [Agaricicola taiwanensis]
MFIPLYDGHPLRYIRFPVMNWSIIGVTVLFWLVFQSGFVIDGYLSSVVSFGLIPAVLFETAVLPEGYAQVPTAVTLISSVFLHGDFLHLATNMLFLWVFGDNVEDAVGHLAYAVFYLVCGAGASLAFALMAPSTQVPLVGASGAVAGVVAAYLMLHPRVRVWVLVLARIPARLGALWVIGAWLAFQVANAFFDPTGQVAWWAHLGGFAVGALLIPVFKRRDVPLFEWNAATS